MLVTHCLPCTEKQARQSSLLKLDLDGIPNSSICRMAGNAMNVACIGSVLFCCALSFDRISWENSKLNNRSIHRVKIWFNCPLQPVAATMMLICNSCMQRYCPAIKKSTEYFFAMCLQQYCDQAANLSPKRRRKTERSPAHRILISRENWNRLHRMKRSSPGKTKPWCDLVLAAVENLWFKLYWSVWVWECSTRIPN